VSATSCLSRACIDILSMSDGSVSEALNLIEQIDSSPPVYGKLWQLLAEWLTIGLVPVAVFGGTWRDTYAVMVINTVSMLFQRFNDGSETLSQLESMIVAFIAGAGAAIDVLDIRDTERCHATCLIMSVIFNYLPGFPIISGAREMKLGNVTLGAGRLLSVVVHSMMLVVGMTLGWSVSGYNSFTEHINTQSASLPPASYCSEGAYEGWVEVYAGCGSIWLFVFLVYLGVDPRDLPAAFPLTYGIWCLYGYLAETQPQMPAFLLEAALLFFAMTAAGLEEFRGGLSRVVVRVSITRAFAPSATAIIKIIRSQHVGNTTGYGSDFIGHFFFIGVAYAVGDGVAQVLWHPGMYWKRRHGRKTTGFTFADRLADKFMVDQFIFADRPADKLEPSADKAAEAPQQDPNEIVDLTDVATLQQSVRENAQKAQHHSDAIAALQQMVREQAQEMEVLKKTQPLTKL